MFVLLSGLGLKAIALGPVLHLQAATPPEATLQAGRGGSRVPDFARETTANCWTREDTEEIELSYRRPWLGPSPAEQTIPSCRVSEASGKVEDSLHLEPRGGSSGQDRLKDSELQNVPGPAPNLALLPPVLSCPTLEHEGCGVDGPWAQISTHSRKGLERSCGW